MRAKGVGRAVRVLVLGSTLLAIVASLNLAEPSVLWGMNHGRAAAAPPQDNPIGAQAAPSASIAAPSAAIGDFGASQGNVWDMDSTADMVWRQENFRVEKLTTGSIVRGHIPPPAALAFALYTSSTTNLPSREYHHLTYKLKIAAQGSCRTNGRIVYAERWPNWLGSQVNSYPIVPHHPPMTTKGCQYGQFCIYYMDLSSNQNYSNPTWKTDPPPWPNDTIKAFGMWPHEWWVNCSGGPDHFDVDFVYLTGDIVAREKDGYQYIVKWNVSDANGGSIVSSLRYKEVAELLTPSQSPACNAGNFQTGWTYIGQKTTNLSPGSSLPNKVYLPVMAASGVGTYNETYAWTLTGTDFEDGKSYYVCIQVDDGGAQSYAVSSAPVIRVPLSSYVAPND